MPRGLGYKGVIGINVTHTCRNNRAHHFACVQKLASSDHTMYTAISYLGLVHTHMILLNLLIVLLNCTNVLLKKPNYM